METINNAVNAAAEVIWPTTNEQSTTAQTQTQTGSAPKTGAYNSNATSGSASHLDNSQEPLSGVLGNTKAGEPYDAGNKAEQDEALDAKSSGSNRYTNSATGTANTSSTTNSYNDNPAGTSVAAGAAGLKGSRVPNTSVDDGSAGQTGLDGIDNPSGGGATSSNASIASNRMAGGGTAGTPGGASSGASGGPPPPAGNASSEVQTESKGEGTGEKYIRSTGLKADGGDFDAAREGAGREADRLLDEKGISVSKPSAGHDTASSSNPTAGPNSGSSSDATKEKKSLGDKIKEKLHK